MSTDYDAFLRRLESFNAIRWQPHKYSATPIDCARCGWRNTGFRALSCDQCCAQVPFHEDMIQMQPGLTREQSIEVGLMELHKMGCPWRLGPDPIEFSHLQLSHFESVSRKFQSRFDKLDILWDLPELQVPCLVDSSQVQMKLLSEHLIKQQLRPFKGETQYEAVFSKRVQCQMLLALLGWEMHWVPRLVYLNNEQGYPDLTEGLQNDPMETQMAFGRQCYLLCRLCQATLGLWSVETFSDLTVDQFRQLRKCQEAAREARKPLMHDQPSQPKIDESPAPSPASTAQLRQPVFGIKRFARATPSDLPPREEPTEKLQEPTESAEEAAIKERFSMLQPVRSHLQFNPIDAHQHFCPYKSEWTALLATIIGTD